MLQGKTTMVLNQCMDTLNDMAALADKAFPRTEQGLGSRCRVNWTEFGCDSDSDNDNDEDEDVIADGDLSDEEVISCLVHKIAQKKQIGFIGREKWARPSAECHKYLWDMSPDVRAELCASLADEVRGGGGTSRQIWPRHLDRTQKLTQKT
jgi:hypothetical protein